MRYAKIHNFLVWAGPAFVAFISACILSLAALAQSYPGVKDWGKALFDRWWPIVSAQWFVVAVAVVTMVYIVALIRTGQDGDRSDTPTMSFPLLVRYIGRKSRWAAKRSRSADSNWIVDAFDEIRRQLVLGRLSGYGVCGRRPDGGKDFGPSEIPISFWQQADFDPNAAYDLREVTISEVTKPNFQIYYNVEFDPEKVRNVWPPRSALAAVLQRSPAERLGFPTEWKSRDN